MLYFLTQRVALGYRVLPALGLKKRRKLLVNCEIDSSPCSKPSALQLLGTASSFAKATAGQEDGRAPFRKKFFLRALEALVYFAVNLTSENPDLVKKSGFSEKIC